MRNLSPGLKIALTVKVKMVTFQIRPKLCKGNGWGLGGGAD